MSSGWTGRPPGVVAVICSRTASAASLPGVSVAPGATALTLTPRGPNSADHDRLSCSAAAFVAVYMAAYGLPTTAIQEPIVTMDPAPRAAIAGASAATSTC